MDHCEMRRRNNLSTNLNVKVKVNSGKVDRQASVLLTRTSQDTQAVENEVVTLASSRGNEMRQSTDALNREG